EQGRNFHRNPAILASRSLEGRLEKIGGVAEIFEGKLEEEGLAQDPSPRVQLDRGIVGIRVPDCVIENGGVRGESGDREIMDETPQGSAGIQSPGGFAD